MFTPSVDTAMPGRDMSTLWDVKLFKIVVANYGTRMNSVIL